MISKLLHLSDLHVGKSKKESSNLKIIVTKIIEKWENHENKPVILITGDLVDDGKEKQFLLVRKILDPLYQNGFIVLPVPGNHDYGWNGNHAIESRFKYLKNAFFPLENISYPHPYPCGYNGHILIGLNSMKAETGFFDGLLADGELGSKQINNTLGILRKVENRKRSEQKVIVYLHHHPFLYPDDNIVETIIEKVGHQLKDGEDFMHKISNQVDIILFGHQHRHLNFSLTKMSKKYGIDVILSCGQSTDNKMKEYQVDNDGKAGEIVLNKGLMGNLISIETNGTITTETISF